MKHKYVRQENEKDCAVACLYNIIKYYKGNISMDKLRNMLNTNKNGTSVYDIVKTSNNLGLITNAYECEINDLCNLTFPIICHIKINKKYDHYVIIDKIIDDEIFIFDPIRGYLKYDIDKFQEEWTNIIITFEKTEKLINETSDNILFNIKLYILKNSKIIFMVFTFSIISSLLYLIHTLYLSYLYKNPVSSKKIFLLFMLICIIKFFIDLIKNNIILNYSKSFDYDITYKTYKKILSLPLEYHHNRPVGDIISRINDLSSVKELVENISFSFIIDLGYILMISIILFIINKIMFILLFIMLIIYFLVYLLFRNKLKNMSLLNKENLSQTNTLLVESILGIDTIKNNNIVDRFFNIFNKKYKSFLNDNFSFNKMIANYELLQEFICNISSVIIIFISILFYKKNIISLSNVIAFNSLVFNIFISLKNIISMDQMLIDSKNSIKRLNALKNEKEEEKRINNNVLSINKISIKNLYYSYNNTYNILNNISFIVNKNDKIFVKGKSGSGKSTIFKLLTKQMKIDKNMIKINNIDINDINTKDIVNNICLVSQNEYIFTDTILNNIKLYEEAKKEEIDKVIRITGIDRILEKRKITLDFLLEENGHNLSGGERQRIILARSLLHKKKVLILDETMNELDISSERNIIKKIIQEYDLTLILISHRDNNSDLFNKIIKL